MTSWHGWCSPPWGVSHVNKKYYQILGRERAGIALQLCTTVRSSAVEMDFLANVPALYLETFYYVIREGGIANALPLIRPKVQQPTVTRYIQSIEAQAGHPLFTRRPGGRMEPNAQGRELYEDIKEGFDSLDAVRRRAGEKKGPRLSMGTSQFVWQHYLSHHIAAVERRWPDAKLKMEDGATAQLLNMLRRDAVDVVIAAVDAPCPEFPHMILMKLAPVLVVAATSSLRHSAQVFQKTPVPHRLVRPAASEGVSRIFNYHLKATGFQWACTREVGATAMVPHVVANDPSGASVGLCLAVGKMTRRPDLRVLPLQGFPPVTLVAQWNPRTSPLVDAFLQQVQGAAPKVAETILA